MSMCQEWIHQGYINIVQPFHANVKRSVAQQILTASTVLVVVPYNFSDINTHNQYATGVGPLVVPNQCAPYSAENAYLPLITHLQSQYLHKN